MPLYSYSCPDCDFTTEIHRTMARRNAKAKCEMCDGNLVLVFEAPRALRTDTTFQAGFKGGDGCRDEATRRKLHKNARRKGLNINGKKYDGRLAKYWGDPEACYGSMSEARRVVERAGESSEELGVKQREVAPQPYRLADDIVERYVDEVVRDEPVTPKKRAELRKEMREKHSPSDRVCS